MIMRLGYTVFFLLAVSAACMAQEIPFLHFTMDDGLPSNKVYTTYRDSKGYMWVATDKGIGRYNGIGFETYTTYNGLPDNEVFFFQEDYSGRLWMATYNGDLCYFKDDTFHTQENTAFLKMPFKASFIKRIDLENDSSISIFFWKNTKFINIKNDQIHVLDLFKTSFAVNPALILGSEKINVNRYRIYGPDNITEIDSSGQVHSSLRFSGVDLGNEQPQYWGVVSSQNQTYLKSEHCLFNKHAQVVVNLHDTFLKKNNLYMVYHNSLSYFFCTTNGIVLNGSLRILQGHEVSSVNQDKQGNYWATTLENGLFIFDKYFMNTRHYKDAYKGKVQYVHADNGHIFFTARDNFLYQLSGGKITQILNNGHYLTDDPKSPESRFFLIDSANRYFYFNNREGIVSENLVTAPLSIRKYRFDPNNGTVVKAGLIAGNKLVINADVRIIETDILPSSGSQIKYATLSDDANKEKIFGFAKAPDNSIWYSTVNHIYRVTGQQAVEQIQFKIPSFKLFGFFGEYLIGYTHYNKLYICKNYNKDVQYYPVYDQNCIWDKFYKLDDNHVLISTNNYYRLLNLTTQKITIVENPFIPPQAEAICSDGDNIYFFKNGGVTSIELNRFLLPADPPKLYFTYLYAGSKVFRIDRNVEIPFSLSKNITLSFATLSYSGKNVLYYYSVSKDEDNWQPLNGEDINLVNPGSGYYTIKVKARTVSSGFSAPIVFTLYVERPLLANWWFITLCVWLAIAIVALVIRYRLRIILKKKERLYETEIKFMKSEYKAMNALMNPHFIFNTLNNVQSLVNANDKVAANEYLRIFADLIRQNMHNISKELIPLQKEVDLVGNYLSLEKLRFEDKLTFSIKVEDNLDLSEIMIPPLLIQPLVENSIKHGILPLHNRKGIIKLELFEANNELHIEVRDNGVGMAKSSKKDNPLHESFGLSNIRKRIEQLSMIQNKKITFNISEQLDKTDLQNWTIVSIIIPFNDSVE